MENLRYGGISEDAYAPEMVVCVERITGGSYPLIELDPSGKYADEDLSAAVEQIREVYKNWQGKEIYSITYREQTQAEKEKNLVWMNQLGQADNYDLKPELPFDECVCFEMNFRTPGDPVLSDPLEASTIYTNFGWWLARKGNDRWYLLAQGY